MIPRKDRIKNPGGPYGSPGKNIQKAVCLFLMGHYQFYLFRLQSVEPL